MESLFSLNDKKILVTGASSGIGKGISIDCSKMGASLYITARNKQRLEDTLSLLSGENHHFYVADLSLESNIDSMVKELPIIDGVVLCAGIIKTMPAKHIKRQAINEIFDINIISSILLVSKLLKFKKIKEGGSIVFISSVSTFNVKIGNSLYSATKGAVNSFTKALALELAKQKIRVNSIQPGFVPSSILSNGTIDKDDYMNYYIERHPLGLGTPSDIANGCIYLLSDASKWVTGSIFTIDGGYTLQ